MITRNLYSVAGIRPLTVALAQVPGRKAGDLDGFVGHATATMRRFPGTLLLAYPELHLTSESDVDSSEPVAAFMKRVVTPTVTWLASLMRSDPANWFSA